MRESIDVSIVIVNWNSWCFLRDCLDSIASGSEGFTYEVIVVDNASTDFSCAEIARDYSWVTLFRNKENLGFAAANNRGIRQAQGRYVLLLNPDTIVHHGAINATICFAESRPRCGIVGCRTLNADGTLQHNCFLPPSSLNFAISTLGLHKAFPRNRVFGRERMTFWRLDTSREVPNVTGCYMLVRHEAITEVGLLDEQFFMYSEEVDWCQRFRNARWEVWYTPDGTITHYGGVSSAQNAGEMKIEYIRSLILYIDKHHGCVERSFCRVLIAVTLVTRMPLVVLRAGDLNGTIRRTLAQLKIVLFN